MSHAVNRVKSLAFLTGVLLLPAVSSFCEETHNLEVLFKKSYYEWEPDSVYSFGSAICSAGDVNGDGYDDVAAVGWDLGSCKNVKPGLLANQHPGFFFRWICGKRKNVKPGMKLCRERLVLQARRC
jgi:hypothetical protein